MWGGGGRRRVRGGAANWGGVRESVRGRGLAVEEVGGGGGGGGGAGRDRGRG